MFIPAHDAVVLYALETGSITESADGDSAATLPAAPSSPLVIGYTNMPKGGRGLNNSKGFAVGQQGAAYNKRGAVAPDVSLEIRPGSVEALEHLFPTDGALPYLAIFVVVKGQYTDVYRFCKVNNVTCNFNGGSGKGGEITISADFMATSYQRGAALTVSQNAIRALGTPLFWHDVRQFDIAPAPGEDAVSYRRALMSLSAKVAYNLERKNQRPNWGDSSPLSRTSYALLEHTVAASGEIGLHERLPEALLTGAVNAQDWGDIVLRCSDSALGSDDSKGFTLTMTNCFPSDETQAGGDASAEITYTVPFTADDISFELES